MLGILMVFNYAKVGTMKVAMLAGPRPLSNLKVRTRILSPQYQFQLSSFASGGFHIYSSISSTLLKSYTGNPRIKEANRHDEHAGW
jgi:hypothetical protein